MKKLLPLLFTFLLCPTACEVAAAEAVSVPASHAPVNPKAWPYLPAAIQGRSYLGGKGRKKKRKKKERGI